MQYSESNGRAAYANLHPWVAGKHATRCSPASPGFVLRERARSVTRLENGLRERSRPSPDWKTAKHVRARPFPDRKIPKHVRVSRFPDRKRSNTSVQGDSRARRARNHCAETGCHVAKGRCNGLQLCSLGYDGRISAVIGFTKECYGESCMYEPLASTMARGSLNIIDVRLFGLSFPHPQCGLS